MLGDESLCIHIALGLRKMSAGQKLIGIISVRSLYCCYLKTAGTSTNRTAFNLENESTEGIRPLRTKHEIKRMLDLNNQKQQAYLALRDRINK